jgi:DNA-binding NarL/FixJ family response regulator
MNRIRVLIADDHEILRNGLAATLGAIEQMAVVGEAENGRRAVALFDRLRPDVTIMDMQMPEMNGLEALRAIRALDPKAKVLALTTYQGDALVRQALCAGAAGYILKRSVRKELIDAVVAIANGGKYIANDVATALTGFIDRTLLSRREIEVLQLVADGNSNKRIAVSLALSEDTVKGHVKNILSKLGANDRTHAVALAIKRGVFDL